MYYEFYIYILPKLVKFTYQNNGKYLFFYNHYLSNNDKYFLFINIYIITFVEIKNIK